MAYSLSKEEVLKVLNSNSNTGLNNFEVEIRQKKYGRNHLSIHKSKSVVSLFVNQIRDPMVYILFFKCNFINFYA